MLFCQQLLIWLLRFHKLGDSISGTTVEESCTQKFFVIIAASVDGYRDFAEAEQRKGLHQRCCSRNGTSENQSEILRLSKLVLLISLRNRELWLNAKAFFMRQA